MICFRFTTNIQKYDEYYGYEDTKIYHDSIIFPYNWNFLIQHLGGFVNAIMPENLSINNTFLKYAKIQNCEYSHNEELCRDLSHLMHNNDIQLQCKNKQNIINMISAYQPIKPIGICIGMQNFCNGEMIFDFLELDENDNIYKEFINWMIDKEYILEFFEEEENTLSFLRQYFYEIFE